MVIGLAAVIGIFVTLITAIVCFTLIWFRSCKMAEHDNMPKVLETEGKILRDYYENN